MEEGEFPGIGVYTGYGGGPGDPEGGRISIYRIKSRRDPQEYTEGEIPYDRSFAKNFIGVQ